jgi:hypothetical protein
VDFLLTLLASVVTSFQVAYSELVTFVGERPLIAALIGAAFLLVIAIPEIRHQRRQNREATR